VGGQRGSARVVGRELADQLDVGVDALAQSTGAGDCTSVGDQEAEGGRNHCLE
jgi:hypothetical protein